MSLRTRLGVSALALAVLSTTAGPAGAAGSVADGGPAGAAATVTSVTLVTGDRALVSVGAGGKTSVTLATDEPYATRQVGDDLYVVPQSAAAMIAAGRLDERLFNVSGLIRQGYDDARRDTLPLIVDGAAALPRSADVTTRALGASGATAVQVKKTAAGALFDGLTAARSMAKIWLDGRVSGVDLDPGTGVGQTGAEQVWKAGFDGTGTKIAVLDSGYDPNHPDLKGQLAAAEDFTGSGTAADGDGHGTHVASTALGSGAADASRKGMAPGAKLLVGRVLDSWGGGQESWIIAGMEWAVAQGADVINMSLGSQEPTDCTDPMSAAAQRLSEQSKSLFVIAAGNSAARETVSSPGCAAGVLTVGAVDVKGETAAFSSRGPVLGDHRLKPEIAAPGVETVGAANGSVGGIHYIKMSGTSMASPHVAGAAALVRQAHPGWTAQQVKAALVSGVKANAKDHVYAQGAGELSVPGAIAASVQGPGTVDLGSFAWPHDGRERATKELVYTNLGDREVRLQLRIEDLAGKNGARIPRDSLKLGRHTVTVPAGGSATVPVTADPDGHFADEAYGEIGARVVATGRGGVSVTTAVGFWVAPKIVKLTVKTIGRDGNAPAGISFVDVVGLDEERATRTYVDGSPETVYELPVGRYAVSALLHTAPALAYLGDPELDLHRDTTLVYDARQALPIQVKTDRPSTISSGFLQYGRWWDRWQTGGGVTGPITEFYAAPSSRARLGGFELGAYLRATFDGGVYNLAFIDEGRVGRDQSHVVRDSGLAAVEETWYGEQADEAAGDFLAIHRPWSGNSFGGWDVEFTVPGKRLSLYSPDVTFEQIAFRGSHPLWRETWYDIPRTYRPGQKRSATWLRLPSMTGVFPGYHIAERQGDLIGYSTSRWKDSDPDHYGAGAYFGDAGNLTLSKDGQVLETSAWPFGQFLITDGTYELTSRQLRFGSYDGGDQGAMTTTTYRFTTTRPEGEEVVALPFLVVGYDAEVDSRNTAAPEAGFPVRISVAGQSDYDAGAMTSVKAWVSTDDQKVWAEDESAWSEVPVAFRDGAWVASVDNAAATGKHVSIKVSAVDSHGNAITQVVNRLYGVR
ncbi:S8 family peptidase [Nonomuraea sp. NPDC050663]|uniref:S8 family peptidase n=1 Tax=Nonomuraea sp. NPDC050663 TaxID=3364370 RepID=UPI003793A2DF